MGLKKIVKSIKKTFDLSVAHKKKDEVFTKIVDTVCSAIVPGKQSSSQAGKQSSSHKKIASKIDDNTADSSDKIVPKFKPPPKKRSDHEKEMIKKIKRLWNQGESLPHLSQRFNISIDKVYEYLKS